MNQKQIGIIVIVLGIIIAGLLFMAKEKEDYYISNLVTENGTCVLEDGYCLHEDRSFALYIIGSIISSALVILGIYLYFFDKTQQQLAEHQKTIVHALEQTVKKDEFKIFLEGFSPDEQKVLSCIHEQEGIQQSTLRYKTGMSKTALSLLITSLEKREIISKSADGKTNKLFLRKKF